MMEGIKERLDFFREMTCCCYDLNLWVYDNDLQLISTTCENAKEIQFFFSFEQERVDALRKKNADSKPIVGTNSLGMMVIADFERDEEGNVCRTHIMGPAFVEDVSENIIENELIRLRLSPATRSLFANVLRKLPYIAVNRFLEYGQMMHYCITGERMNVTDYQYASAAGNLFEEEEAAKPTVHTTWQQEQQMMKLMEEGNLEYRRYAGAVRNVGMLADRSSIRQVKNITIIHTALCTRSAIRGGLDPEIAYTLSDRYINGIEACASVADIAEINSAMQDDFIHRVHRCRANPDISPQIQKCCDYIQMNLNRKISSQELAEWAGYSEGHLSKRFKAETGKTVKEYTMECRIESAKQMLRSGNASVMEISERLGFGSQSYFGEQFRKAVGMSPKEYREKGEPRRSESPCGDGVACVADSLCEFATV